MDLSELFELGRRMPACRYKYLRIQNACIYISFFILITEGNKEVRRAKKEGHDWKKKNPPRYSSSIGALSDKPSSRISFTSCSAIGLKSVGTGLPSCYTKVKIT